MHIVAITGNYIPFMKPPVRCLSPYLEDLSVDNDVDVLCPVYSRRYTNDCTLGNINIHFVDSYNNRLLSVIQTYREEQTHKFLVKILYLLFRTKRFLGSLLRREAYETDLIQPFINRVEQIHKNNPIDVLISVSFPFYNHIAAFEIKKRYHDIRWITFTTDPISYSESNPLPSFKLALAKKQEKEVYDGCDFCICTEELLSNIVDDFKIKTSKVMPLPFLLSPFDSGKRITRKNLGSKLLVLYAGYVYYKIRNPRLMIDVFSKLTNIELELYVRGDRFCRKYFSSLKYDNIHINDMVSRESYMQLLADSDVLINLSNTVRLQAPSKLLELVSTGKPVINFYHHQDTGYHIIEKYPLGINISNHQEVDDIIDAVKAFIDENKGKLITFDELKTIYPEHLFDNQKMNVRFAIYDTHNSDYNG